MKHYLLIDTDRGGQSSVSRILIAPNLALAVKSCGTTRLSLHPPVEEPTPPIRMPAGAKSYPLKPVSDRTSKLVLYHIPWSLFTAISPPVSDWYFLYTPHFPTMLWLGLSMNAPLFQKGDQVTWSQTARQDPIMSFIIGSLGDRTFDVVETANACSNQHPQDIQLDVPHPRGLNTWMCGIWFK